MQLYTHKSTKILKKIPVGVFLATVAALCLIGGISMTRHFTKASSSEYSLTGSSVELDGEHDGAATVSLKTSVARTYVAIQGKWSLKEVVTPGATQTSYLNLSGMKRGGTIALAYSDINGATAWTPELNEAGMPVLASGDVLTATYTVDKDTPAGTYKVSFSEGIFMYDINGSDVDEEDEIALDATITVTRNESNNNGGDNNGGDDENENNNNNDNNGDDENNNGGENNNENENSGNENNNNDENENTDPSTPNEPEPNNDPDDELVVPNTGTDNPSAPDTGRMTQDGDGMNAVMLPIAAIVSVAVLSVATAQILNHKKIGFNKA